MLCWMQFCKELQLFAVFIVFVVDLINLNKPFFAKLQNLNMIDTWFVLFIIITRTTMLDEQIVFIIKTMVKLDAIAFTFKSFYFCKQLNLKTRVAKFSHSLK